MKKIFTSIAVLSLFATLAKAQDSNITAILDKEPAIKEAELNANAEKTMALGEQGIVKMLGMLQAPGQADNTKIYDAISGFSFYITQRTREPWRIIAVKAYCTALSKVSDKENQAFIISQLQMIGKDDAVPTLKSYLNDERLCDPAARALVKVNTPASKAALLSALSGSQGNCKITLIEALGDSKNALAVHGISAQIGKDKMTDKVALYALANIASPASINLMANAADQAKYTYDVTDATSAYLMFIRNLGAKNAVTATKLAKALQTKASLANQVQTKTAALKILVDLQGIKSTTMLISATRDNNPQYRDAALKFAQPYITPATTALWTNELLKAGWTQKVAIIKMLGITRPASALPAVEKQIYSQESEVVIAAIDAAGKIGQDKAIPDLLNVLRTGDANRIEAVQNAA